MFFCPHSPEEACHCRKPAPGLFEQIAERFGVSMKGVPVVGDTLRDLQAGVALGCDQDLTAFVAHWLPLAPDGGPEAGLTTPRVNR